MEKKRENDNKIIYAILRKVKEGNEKGNKTWATKLSSEIKKEYKISKWRFYNIWRKLIYLEYIKTERYGIIKKAFLTEDGKKLLNRLRR